RKSSSSSRAPVSLPRGPPRKPKQSGHALWVGNLPAGATVLEIRDIFAADGIESVFLISKSFCAFVNYQTEAQAAAALEKFKSAPVILHGAELVARFRRDPSTNPNNSRNSGHTDWAQTRPFANSYFIIKSLTLEDLDLSLRLGVWATQPHNEPVFNEAFEKSDNVYLIFSANKSGEYYGYARMLSKIVNAPLEVRVAQDALFADSDDTDLPKMMQTQPGDNIPSGRVVDDSVRGTMFWEALKDPNEETSPGREEGQDVDKTWGMPFKIKWESTNKIPFFRTRYLRNSWNSNLEVKIARDGTEVEPHVGASLLELF
ncbi:hypothetical protein CANCADRAFT_20446, partial [Tortispora caseinolytica NRRL Y-17796]